MSSNLSLQWANKKDCNKDFFVEAKGQTTCRKIAKYAAIGTIAIAALGAAIAGGLCIGHVLNFSHSAIIGAAFGELGSIVIAGGVGATLTFIITKQKTKRDNTDPAAYKLVTWNIGTIRDGENMSRLRRAMETGKSFITAREKFGWDQRDEGMKKEDEKLRNQQFASTVQLMGNPAFICLQETHDYTKEEILSILPKGYAFYKQSGKDCLVAWDTKRFTCLKAAAKGPNTSDCVTPLDAIVLLKDRQSGKTISIASTHLSGYNLGDETLPRPFTQADMSGYQREIGRGNLQAEINLNTLANERADLQIFAGDFNVSREFGSHRLELLEQRRYQTDTSDQGATIFDANLRYGQKNTAPRPVKLDHVFVHAKRNVSIRSSVLEGADLYSMARPSDHLPVQALITVC